jgi:seryl-tRNA synthetase
MLDTHVDENGLDRGLDPGAGARRGDVGHGQLPKFAEDSYRTENGWWLIPTAEVTLTNRWRARSSTRPPAAALDRLDPVLPLGSGLAGKDTRGMLRQHQFEKVEMVSIVPTARRGGAGAHDPLRRGILEASACPTARLTLCTGDMGFGARKTHDLEVWLPGQGRYREISSCSLCGDFQARRMNAPPGTGPANEAKPEFAATLNGSGLAVGRSLIAVLENGRRTTDLGPARRAYPS